MTKFATWHVYGSLRSDFDLCTLNRDHVTKVRKSSHGVGGTNVSLINGEKVQLREPFEEFVAWLMPEEKEYDPLKMQRGKR